MSIDITCKPRISWTATGSSCEVPREAMAAGSTGSLASCKTTLEAVFAWQSLPPPCSRPPESRIGADPTLTGAFTWLKWEEKLAEYKLRLVALEDNPIDQVWVDRPKRNSEELEVHELAYAGTS